MWGEVASAGITAAGTVSRGSPAELTLMATAAKLGVDNLAARAGQLEATLHAGKGASGIDELLRPDIEAIRSKFSALKVALAS